MKLNWKNLVDVVKSGQVEMKDANGETVCLYSKARNTFISDPYLIKQITYARKHRNPFLLIGEFGTGKNIFLELVAKGESSDGAIECIDENIDGTQDEMLEKFFGTNNLIENHPNSLFHVDLLQNAIDWPIFLDKLHEVARKNILYRTDGKKIIDLNVRIVGGATVELEHLLKGKGASSAKYLYEYLATNQLVRTKKLIDQLDRLKEILSEILAAQILDPRSQITEDHVKSIESISEDQIERLREYLWPDGFYELVRFVRNSLTEKNWIVDLLEIIPKKRLKAFICHSSNDSEKVNKVCDWLVEHNVDVWISTEKILPGQEWEFEIKREIHTTDLVIICFTKNTVSKEGFIQTEITRALEVVERKPEGAIYLIPLRLEQCDLPFRISKYQYVDFFDPKGQSKLLLALRNRATTLGKAPIGPKSYLETR